MKTPLKSIEDVMNNAAKAADLSSPFDESFKTPEQAATYYRVLARGFQTLWIDEAEKREVNLIEIAQMHAISKSKGETISKNFDAMLNLNQRMNKIKNILFEERLSVFDKIQSLQKLFYQ